jgi:hypothetical protein
MPSIPIVDAPIPSSTGGSFAKQQPHQINPVRANPGLLNAKFQAASNLGNAISDIGELGFRVKNATDNAYVTRSQTSMEAEQADFANWTKTNPDPSTWNEELDARIKSRKEQVQEGAKALSPMAQQRLALVQGEWESRFRGRTQLQATEQSLQIAQASYNDFVAQATANSDLPAIEAKVAEGVAEGVFHPKTASSIVSRARGTIVSNSANALIEADPFEAARQLSAKDESGEYLNFQELSPQARVTMEFRANKMAAQVRGATQREWSSAMNDAINGRGPIPDKEAIMEEAKAQGISPKWVNNLFRMPGQFDEAEYAAARRELMTLDLLNDETGQNNARASAIVTQFKGFAAEQLGKVVNEKLKPDAPMNSPIAKYGVEQIEDMFKIGGYGSYKRPMAGGLFQDDPALKQKAEVVLARNLDLFEKWVKDNPKATHEQAQKYINGLNASNATNNGARMIINSGAFGFPPAKK